MRNDSIIPFSRVEWTRALTIMPGTKRSIESPFRSLIYINQRGIWHPMKMYEKRRWTRNDKDATQRNKWKHTALLDTKSASEFTITTARALSTLLTTHCKSCLLLNTPLSAKRAKEKRLSSLLIKWFVD